MSEDRNIQPMSDDQELAKVLAGVSQDADQAQDAGAGSIDPGPIQQPMQPEPAVAVEPPTAPEEPIVVPQPSPAVNSYDSAGDSSLDGIKKEALLELRPLVDQLNVSPEEKFDTYLLLLRSTDDKDLIAPAHEAARGIADEARRAQALLDIIKEIDFLSQAQK